MTTININQPAAASTLRRAHGFVNTVEHLLDVQPISAYAHIDSRGSGSGIPIWLRGAVEAACHADNTSVAFRNIHSVIDAVYA